MSADRARCGEAQTNGLPINNPKYGGETAGWTRVEGAVGRCRGGGSARSLVLLTAESARGENQREREMWDANELLTVVARGEQGEADRAELARPERIGRLGHELLHDVWLSLAPSWVAGHLYASLH